jgi:hypothetical protein
MNWNALEWDRAAEELTWERVRAVSVTHPGVLILTLFYSCADLDIYNNFVLIFDETVNRI